ncbi:VOC family protein [Dyadobacter subterraneus]|uniref:VOC family protein n=1 Tax=Dyadobacter subterraneus TaxID=2773304 RepID=A0ABR9W8D5_9BACT|nr:VOC family protein [Dyadobacter subterraneus]MBE9461729.1 VOC family protein [Dyadobacter subterraneus]
MQKITPFLWYDNQLEEAMNLYISIFDNAKILTVTRYPEGAPGPAGQVMTATFELEGQTFYALNGGPAFNFTEAISFFVDCKTQEEIDDKWERLSEGGSKSQCGWLKDKFGVSWQIVPSLLSELLSDKNPAKAQSVMQAMLKMSKLDIAILQEAYDKA